MYTLDAMNPDTITTATQAQAQVSFWLEYGNVLIPLIVSIATGIAAFLIYRDKVRNLADDVKDIKKEMKDIRDMVIECKTSLKEREPLTKKESPISLTERGNQFLQASGGVQFIDENFTDLFAKVEAHSPKTAYDVQELSKEVLREISNNDKFAPLKEYLFKEGESLEELITVMGVDLRDRILKQKNWNVSDVDKYDPAKLPSSTNSDKADETR